MGPISEDIMGLRGLISSMYTADNSTIETIIEGYRRTVELQKAQELTQSQ